MPRYVLRSSIQVEPIAPGGSVTLPHGIKVEGQNTLPTDVWPTSASPIEVTAITDFEVTFHNPTLVPTEITRFKVEYVWSGQADAAALPPFVWQGAAAGGGGGGNIDVLGQMVAVQHETIEGAPEVVANMASPIGEGGGGPAQLAACFTISSVNGATVACKIIRSGTPDILAGVVLKVAAGGIVSVAMNAVDAIGDAASVWDVTVEVLSGGPVETEAEGESFGQFSVLAVTALS